MANLFKKTYIKVIILVLIVALVIFAMQRCNYKQEAPQPDAQNEVQPTVEPDVQTEDEAEVKDESASEENEETLEKSSDWKSVKAVKDKIRDYKYDLDLTLDVENKTMDGVLNFTYYNNNELAMDDLVFYLYANSYEEFDYRAIEPEYFAYGYPRGFSSGSIDIKSVSITGGGSFEVTGSQNHLLVVNLNEPVQPGKETQLMIEYTVTIPNSYGRFGYGSETISLVNCNPIMAVYDQENGYYDYYYNNIGDPFFSECADYYATITVDKDYLVAPTGTIVETTYEGDMATHTIVGENRRDFGFVASDDFKVISQEINGVTVNSYSFSGIEINAKALKAAIDSIEAFSIYYGEYPYETFNVVETNFFIGGMEYPGMVMIDESYYNSRYEKIMEMIIVHEAAHQWWYAQVGNDQIAEPWLDEALATFSERVYYEHVYPDTYEDMIENYADSSYISRNQLYDKYETRIDMHTLEYGDDYALVVYGFGSWMIDDLRDMLGEEVFYEALNTYLEDNLFQIATREDLEAAIEKVWGEDITPWFDENLQIQVGY